MALKIQNATSTLARANSSRSKDACNERERERESNSRPSGLNHSQSKSGKISKATNSANPTSQTEQSPKKRLAIQLYGYLRSYEACRESFFANLVAPIENAGFEVDIFMHSWDFVEGVKTTWLSEKKLEKDEQIQATPPKTPSKEDLTELYRLKDISITAQPSHKDGDKYISMPCDWGDYRFQSLVGLYYSEFSVNQLRENYAEKYNITYDLVLVTRPDLRFFKPFNVIVLQNGNVENKIFGFYTTWRCEQHTLDTFFLGTPSVISQIAGIYKTLDYKTLQKANLFNPESIMQKFLIKNKIELLCLNDWSAPFEILRSDLYNKYRKLDGLQNLQSPIISVQKAHYDELKRLEHLGGFLKFYARKRIKSFANSLAKIRRKTRAVRYPIKRFFGFGKTKNSQNA